MLDHDAAGRSPTLPAGLPDGWLFDRDLNCPQCKYNLRMLSQPRCPECGTVFRWQTLLHVSCPRCGEGLGTVDDGECPRCGLELNWEKLLGDADPALHRHFEYTTKPIRAIIPTWFAALRPAHFWGGMSLEYPPAVSRLRWLHRADLLICLAATVACMVVNWSFWGDYGSPAFWAAPFMLPLITGLALPLFVSTLARFQIRRDQIARCRAYSSIGVVWIGFILIAAAVFVIAANVIWPRTWFPAGTARVISFPRLGIQLGYHFGNSWRYDRDIVAAGANAALAMAVLYFSLLWWWRFLWVSLRHYLRIDHHNAVALFASTQVVGLLLVAVLLSSDEAFLRFIGGWLIRLF